MPSAPVAQPQMSPAPIPFPILRTPGIDIMDAFRFGKAQSPAKGLQLRGFEVAQPPAGGGSVSIGSGIGFDMDGITGLGPTDIVTFDFWW